MYSLIEEQKLDKIFTEIGSLREELKAEKVKTRYTAKSWTVS